ncbi:flap structure-specific endonuclease [Salinibaculum rarum]|uniref:flap structure-specific endonuclease n=1 Tax=Salinibaculum rarum TaxID=3058903 RepID=UPI00265FF4FD|nr:flap structure-specific endonuclease [Salinibaculum sp. KK48]
MGNSALRDLATIEETELTNYTNTTVAVDAHHWLYTYITAQIRWLDEDDYTTTDGDEVVNLIGALRGLPTLLNHDLTPVFVFDGNPHDRKEDEIQDRRATKVEAEAKMQTAREEGNLEAMRRYKAQSQSLTDVVHETTREFFDILGIPYIEADGAGEATAARLVETGAADAALTDDYDALLFGAPETVRQYTGSGPAERMDFYDTLAAHDITHEQLVDIALLCGTDYNDGVHGVGPNRALNYVTDGQCADEIAAEYDDPITGLDELRTLFLDPPTGDFPATRFTLGSPDFQAAREFASDQWELPTDMVDSNLDRFPSHRK